MAVYKTSKRLQARFKSSCQQKEEPKKRLLNAGTNIEQKPWQPTTQRKGKNAGHQSLGKPSYKLVPPLLGPNIIDSKKKSAPAYSISRKTTRRHSHIEDGPAKYNVAGIYNKGVHRPPAFSLKFRPNDLKKWSPPEPGRYNIQTAILATTKSTPAFSFGKRPIAIKSLPTPAPNVYNLPTTLGTAKESQIKAAPAYSLIGRDKPRQIPAFILPGPGQYEDNSKHFRKSPPKYSMHTRHKVISDEHLKPGPGAYCPERYIKHKSVPAPSFSIRHTPHLGEKKIYLIPEPKMIPSKPEWIL
ncbi:ciliary microtubule associated protein 1A-like [Musca vetustissima]|uniref:ciliary microtubule associated protein 1A-like n=1 Tax=Musca vetustissima TaxID=27455 RepID=UPI002AB618D5|nr:ciliary microtubule associated protein 1A-like [Musca vetustissima]